MQTIQIAEFNNVRPIHRQFLPKPIPIVPVSHLTVRSRQQSAMPQHHFHDHSHHIRDQIRSVLARSPYFSGRNLEIDVHADDVVLRGVVPSYYQKQMAQETIRSIEGGRQIRNELEVMSV